MKRIITFLLVAIMTLSAVPQDPISRPGKKKQNTTRTTNASQKRKLQEAEQKRKAKEEQERKEQEERDRKKREEQERIAKEEQARREREEQERRAYEASLQGTHNGYEWVDLGLSVKWATKNVGASSPSDYGDYYAWGETSTKSSYTKKNSLTYKKKIPDISGNPQYDVARARWGGSWRLPTKAELEELKNKCTWTWTTQGGHKGYKVTGKNGKSIFLPAAGWRDETSSYYVGEYGHYWISTPDGSNTDYAYNLYFYFSNHIVGCYRRYDGRSVRPVVE